MGTEIYYFSGTGNSFYVAKELHKKIPQSSLLPIVSLLKQDVIEITGETVGFVFPVHLATVPLPVRLFLEKLYLKSNPYIFAIATRGGTIHRAFIEVDNILKRKGRKLDAHFVLNFFDNNPRFQKYDVPAAEEIVQVQSTAQAELDIIEKIISNRKPSREKDVTFLEQYGFLYRFFLPLFTFLAKHPGSNDDFYADESCSGCGICETVCLADKIKMVDMQPVWQENTKCYSCRACLNFCPVNAVQIKDASLAKSYTRQNGRYPHPFASINDIAEQK